MTGISSSLKHLLGLFLKHKQICLGSGDRKWSGALIVFGKYSYLTVLLCGLAEARIARLANFTKFGSVRKNRCSKSPSTEKRRDLLNRRLRNL